MRSLANSTKVRALMRSLGESARGPGRIYLTGGGSAVLIGWRDTTIDADLKLDPEPAGTFEAIARLKETLDINVELSAPDDFVPPLPGWRERSRFIERHGEVDFFHYDFYGQALSKIERGHTRDLDDVTEMLERGLVDADELERLLAQVEESLLRYPAIEPDTLKAKVHEMVSRWRER